MHLKFRPFITLIQLMLEQLMINPLTVVVKINPQSVRGGLFTNDPLDRLKKVQIISISNFYNSI